MVYFCAECGEPFRPFSRNEATCSKTCNDRYFRVRWLIKKDSGRAKSEAIVDRVRGREPRCRDCRGTRLEFDTVDGCGLERCLDCGGLHPIRARARRNALSKRYDQRRRLERELAMTIAIASERPRPQVRSPKSKRNLSRST